MNASVHFDTYSDARNNLKQLFDAAGQGRVATMRRDDSTAVVVDAGRMRHFLASVVPSRAEVVAEDGGWSVFIPGIPVAADAVSFDDAIEDMVDALREYSADWQDRLRDAPNHRDNWGLVQLIELSDDDELRAWLVSSTQ
ncbi:prevent-host-death protein [Amycolatopsis jejuensis]|uniref:prevent-host-death protein n=1 Tax=Amycolatopsis jejuensis TaxID=330084 RepID=UPI0005250440|nr:prevent-host-death protein [Amycolatopsis jejuensis]